MPGRAEGGASRYLSTIEFAALFIPPSVTFGDISPSRGEIIRSTPRRPVPYIPLNAAKVSPKTASAR